MPSALVSVLIALIAIVVIFILATSIRIVSEFQRLVVRGSDEVRTEL